MYGGGERRKEEEFPIDRDRESGDYHHT